MTKNKRWIILAVVFAAVVLIWILANSINDNAASHRLSNAIIDFLGLDDIDNSASVAITVRKLAHVIEFAVLGAITMSVVLLIRSKNNSFFCGFSFFFVLAVAVADEYIQSLSDRSSSVSDIVLDFVGAMLGFLVVLSAYALFKKLKKIKANK